MAQDPARPRNDGKVRMPSVDGAMNKIPVSTMPKSADDKGTMLGAPKGKAAHKQKILDRIIKRMDQAISAESENRKAGLDDRQFAAGNQWPAEVMAQRNIDKRPCLTINKLPTFIHQITNDQRQNRPAIKISPVGDRADLDVAKMYGGLIRHIERDCQADIAYDTAFNDAVKMGWGYWRVLTEWEAPDSFNLNAKIARIRNPFRVYLDPSAQDPTGADAKWGFITDMIPRGEFEEKYPDVSPMPFAQGGTGELMKSWMTKDEIRIAEYFEIEYKTRTLVQLDNGHSGWEDELDDITLGYIKRGKINIVDERESRVPEVMWYKVTAMDILMERKWLGTSIPIVRVVGEEEDIEGKVKLSGVVRHAKDPQRMYNYWKCISLDTIIPTPSGWTTMKDVETGDTVFGDDGKPCKVVGKSPIHLMHDCFRVEFDDGSHIIADREHPWQVEERGKRCASGWAWSTKIVETADLTPTKHFIGVANPLELPETDLPIDPYLLGAWLGDGKTAEPQLCAGDQDIDEMRANLANVGCNIGPVRRYGDKVGVWTVHGVRKQFTMLGLLGNKHIPPQYLRASREQRVSLLQGLMDTDGSVSATRQCSFTTTLPALAAGFAELLRTLGIKAVSTHRKGRIANVMPYGYTSDCSDNDQFSFSAPPGADIFRLNRKRAIQSAARPTHSRRTKRHRIVSVTPVPSVPVQCIKVDNESHLFLAGPGMVPTHNTAETELIALAPKAPWLVEEGQIEGHEDEFKNANVKSIPYLSYKGTSVNGTMAPPPQRQQFAGVPAGVVQASQGAAQDMQATTGVRFDATMNERMIDESGKAIRELRRTGDLGSFHYVDNLARALRRTGEILVELIPMIYDDARTITILREDDKEEQVRVDPAHPKPTGEMKKPDGKTMRIFNPTYGKYGVTVTIGPSYATKRIEASENMMAFVKALPNTGQLIADLIARNQDWPGAEEIAARLAKTLPPGLLAPDMKDVPPQVQALLTQQDQQVKELGQKLQQAMRELSDKGADRALEAEKIKNDFEARLLKIVSDVETKMAAVQEKSVGNFNAHIGAQLKELGTGVTTLLHALEQPQGDAGDAGEEAPANENEQPQAAQQPAEEQLPPAALRRLMAGRLTHFANGQSWTLGPDGKPLRKK